MEREFTKKEIKQIKFKYYLYIIFVIGIIIGSLYTIFINIKETDAIDLIANYLFEVFIGIPILIFILYNIRKRRKIINEYEENERIRKKKK